jgi:hypothetical protein
VPKAEERLEQLEQRRSKEQLEQRRSQEQQNAASDLPDASSSSSSDAGSVLLSTTTIARLGDEAVDVAEVLAVGVVQPLPPLPQLSSTASIDDGDDDEDGRTVVLELSSGQDLANIYSSTVVGGGGGAAINTAASTSSLVAEMQAREALRTKSSGGTIASTSSLVATEDEHEAREAAQLQAMDEARTEDAAADRTKGVGQNDTTALHEGQLGRASGAEAVDVAEVLEVGVVQPLPPLPASIDNGDDDEDGRTVVLELSSGQDLANIYSSTVAGGRGSAAINTVASIHNSTVVGGGGNAAINTAASTSSHVAEMQAREALRTKSSGGTIASTSSLVATEDEHEAREAAQLQVMVSRMEDAAAADRAKGAGPNNTTAGQNNTTAGQNNTTALHEGQLGRASGAEAVDMGTMEVTGATTFLTFEEVDAAVAAAEDAQLESGYDVSEARYDVSDLEVTGTTAFLTFEDVNAAVAAAEDAQDAQGLAGGRGGGGEPLLHPSCPLLRSGGRDL